MANIVPGDVDWVDGSGGGTPLDAAHIKLEETALKAYIDQLRADVASGVAPLPAAVVNSAAAGATLVPIANGSGGYAWGAAPGGGLSAARVYALNAALGA